MQIFFSFFCFLCYFCTMKYTEKQKQSARDLYVRGNKSQKEIAEMLSIPTSTLTGWVKKGEWEKERASLSLSVDTIIPKILQQINAEIEEKNFNADSLIKYTKSIKELYKNELSPNDYHQVMVKFLDHVRMQASTNPKITPQVLQIICEAQDTFLKSIMS